MKAKEDLHWNWSAFSRFLFWGLCLLLLSLIFSGGCNSQGQKMVDELKSVKKNQEKIQTSMDVQGDQNSTFFQKFHNEYAIQIQQTSKQASQAAEAAAATARDVGEIKISNKNIKNSSWLMFGLFASLILATFGLIFFMVKHILVVQKVKRAFVHNNTDLNPDKWKAI